MRKTILIILTITLFSFFSCKKNYTKNDALKQSQYCLNIKQKIGVLSHKRNPYFLLLAKNIESNIITNSSIIDSIEKISAKIKLKNSEYVEVIEKLKNEQKDTRLFDATVNFLNVNKKLENKTELLFKSLINPKSDKDKEKKMAEEVRKLAINLKNEEIIYKNRESDFHNDHGINQKEVDSIVNIIKN